MMNNKQRRAKTKKREGEGREERIEEAG